MATLYPSLTGSRSLTSMLHELRPEDRSEALAAPHLAQIAASEAKWQWCLDLLQRVLQHPVHTGAPLKCTDTITRKHMSSPKHDKI